MMALMTAGGMQFAAIFETRSSKSAVADCDILIRPSRPSPTGVSAPQDEVLHFCMLLFKDGGWRGNTGGSRRRALFDDHQRFAEFYRLRIFE
jgi:hypothetical protein